MNSLYYFVIDFDSDLVAKAKRQKRNELGVRRTAGAFAVDNKDKSGLNTFTIERTEIEPNKFEYHSFTHSFIHLFCLNCFQMTNFSVNTHCFKFVKPSNLIKRK